VKTVVLGERPPELDALIARRKKLGLDLHDEVWDGEYHMAPYASATHAYIDQLVAVLIAPLAREAGLVATGPFNLGMEDDFRVPDRGLHRGVPSGVYVPTAAAVFEILSPDDETVEKLPFYAARGVEEVLVVDPESRSVRILELGGQTYEPATRSALLDVDVRTLEEAIDWP
jgi:Putative restriction endonuclease